MTQDIRPLTYQIDILPDLNTFRFEGKTTIKFRAQGSVRKVTLNVQELTINICELLQAGNTRAVCPFVMDDEKETLTIDLPEPQTGDFSLFFGYTGIINDAMAGFYRSRFQKNGETHYLAVTQFEESSARRAFPCMDHPLYKAVFELTLTVPSQMTVLANTMPIREEAAENNTKRVTFAPSPVMSTYLVFFGDGDFHIVQD
jgi:aminopeptidase N